MDTRVKPAYDELLAIPFLAFPRHLLSKRHAFESSGLVLFGAPSMLQRVV
jgi:hypothetical protein